MDVVQKLRNASKYEEIDYNFLLDVLKGYANPRDKITWLLKKGVLLRVKKGLYVFGPDYARGAYSVEILANLIYGPSYISMEYALSHYGLIPERVEVVTSVTPKRDKEFKSPVGLFTYRYLHPRKYSVGVIYRDIGEFRYSLMASPEKALADLIALSRCGLDLASESDVEVFLYDDLRLDRDRAFDPKLMTEIANVYRHADIDAVLNYIKKEKR